MSDLGGGAGTARASNGGARTAGPVPVQPGGTTSGIRTPRDIMRDRHAREAQREEEQRRQQEERTKNAERRVPGAVARTNLSSQSAAAAPATSTDRRSNRLSGTVANAEALGEPTSRTTQEFPGSGVRSPSKTRQDAARSAPANTSGTRRTQQTQTGTPRQPISQASAAASSTGEAGRNPASSFPHAFERWETLSAHWEGLTSYWLHKLEQNTEEIRESIPNASTLNRQITDLSAAGANLFHAVVELQRLRASSERKFQRWFFETRADGERHREIQASLERSLTVEKSAREEVNQARANDSIAVENARREVMEMRRELMISKDEARRAWEELGRRNQESLDTAQNLKEGRIAVVAGVQVVPYFGQPSRTGSASQRPVTRDGQGYVSAGLAGAADERQYYREGPSPSNTDPFTDSGRQQYQPQGVGESLGAARAGATSATFTRAGGDRSHVTSGDAERFYQHGGSDTLLHSPETPHAPVTGPRDDVRSEASYVDTVSEGGTEYAIDASGNIQRDDQGRPIIFQRRRAGGGGGGTAAGDGAGALPTSHPGPTSVPIGRTVPHPSESEDDFEREELIRHERALAARFDADDLPEAPSVPPTSAAAMATYPSPTTAPTVSSGRHDDLGLPGPADYEGSGFDNWEDRVRATPHQHPTRLSDVLEEDEERSSRRTVD